jgi:hypothetical protein
MQNCVIERPNGWLNAAEDCIHPISIVASSANVSAASHPNISKQSSKSKALTKKTDQPAQQRQSCKPPFHHNIKPKMEIRILGGSWG